MDIFSEKITKNLRHQIPGCDTREPHQFAARCSHGTCFKQRKFTPEVQVPL